MTAPARAALTEAQFQQQVVELARLRGWFVWHDNDSRRNAPGLPDLILIRERVVWAELKKETGRVRRAQRDVTALLHGAEAEVYLWRPADLPEIQRVLGYRRAGAVSVLERLAAVLEIHCPAGEDGDTSRVCSACLAAWPCPTVRAARGETP